MVRSATERTVASSDGDVPPEVARYAAEPPQLGVGRPGKVGVLRLELAPSNGATRIVRSYSRVPLQVLKALYCDPARPDQAFLYLSSVAGGILQGDRLSVEVVARPGSRAHLTTQAMTKVYRMAHGYATQTVRLRAESGSYLEYLPDPTIPFRGARYHQELVLERAAGGTLLAWDILLPGRVASGEAFAYDIVCLRARGLAAAERTGSESCQTDEQTASIPLLPSFQDTLLLEPAQRDPHATGVLGPFSVIGTLYVLTDAVPVNTLVAALGDAAPAEPETVLGASALPNEAGALARVLGTSSSGVQRALLAAWACVRRLLLGGGLPDLRKY